ncbi:MAG: TetR/AcrR family transcriptional regulator [Bryobacteraceae bacterium]
MSVHSHKSSSKKPRAVQAPQRSNGKLRVAAILEAAAAVIAEKGYEGATMAEIATRSGTKIGSLYRFFPSKESLADTIVVSARENLDAVFDRFDAGVNALSIRALADDLMALIFELFTRPAFMKLLDAGQEWSVKREEFKSALQRSVAETLIIHTPNLSKKSAGDIALVVLLNVKAVATHQASFGPTSSVPDEFRDMTRLYLESRLRPGKRASRHDGE